VLAIIKKEPAMARFLRANPHLTNSYPLLLRTCEGNQQTGGYCWSTLRIVLDDPKVTSLSAGAGRVGVGGVACISGWPFISFYYRNKFSSK
jgi:hypothetical protein